MDATFIARNLLCSLHGSVPLADDGLITDSQIERFCRRASGEPLGTTGMKGGVLIAFGRAKVEFECKVVSLFSHPWSIRVSSVAESLTTS